MSCAKQECVDYVEFVRKIEEKQIDGWVYGVDQQRGRLHDRLCDAYGVDHEKSKKFTLWLNKYLDRAHGDWNKVPELLHDDLTRLADGEDVEPPEEKPVETKEVKVEDKPKMDGSTVGGGAKPSLVSRRSIPLCVDFPNLLKEIGENSDVGFAVMPLNISISLLNRVCEVAAKIDNPELNYYLARLGLIETDDMTQTELVEMYQRLMGKGGFDVGGDK